MQKPSLKAVFSEKNLFMLFSLANLIPVCLTFFMGSLDGPQHLFVSNIIAQLWKGNEIFHQFYVLNPPFIGNVAGNYILAVFNLFLPSWIAEKILIIFYLLALTWGFRYLVISLKGKSGYLTFLIFPFSYHALFMLGYYNFSLAMAFMFISLGFWINNFKNLKFINVLVLLVLFTLTYYSHVLVFGFLLLIIGLYTTFQFIIELVGKDSKAIKNYAIRAGIAVICALPGLIFTYIYIKIIGSGNSPESSVIDYDHWLNLFNLKMLVGYVFSEEVVYTRLLSFLLIALIVWIVAERIFRKVRQYKTGINGNDNIFKTSDFWLVIVVLFMGLYLYIPNQMSISIRLSVMLIYMLILWISLQDFPAKLAIVPIGIILYSGISIQAIHNKYLKPLDMQIRDIQSLESLIPANTLIMTTNYSQNWILYHFQNYLGTEKPLLDLRSPACSELFAVNWNHSKRPFTFVGAKESVYFSGVANNPHNSPAMVAEYIAVVGYESFLQTNPEDITKRILARDYKLIFISRHKLVALYRFSAMEKVRSIQSKLNSKPKSIALIQDKANTYNIPYETMLLRDALWIYDQTFPE